jgi:hypothetical protein
MAIDYDLLKQLINGQITRNEYEAKVAEKEAIKQAQKIAAQSDAKLFATAQQIEAKEKAKQELISMLPKDDQEALKPTVNTIIENIFIPSDIAFAPNFVSGASNITNLSNVSTEEDTITIYDIDGNPTLVLESQAGELLTLTPKKYFTSAADAEREKQKRQKQDYQDFQDGMKNNQNPPGDGSSVTGSGQTLYWGRYDSGSWATSTMAADGSPNVDPDAGFTWAWKLPEFLGTSQEDFTSDKTLDEILGQVTDGESTGGITTTVSTNFDGRMGSQIWQDSTGQKYLAFGIPGTNMFIRYKASDDDLSGFFTTGMPDVRTISEDAEDWNNSLWLGNYVEIDDDIKLGISNPLNGLIDNFARVKKVQPWMEDDELYSLYLEGIVEDRDIADYEWQGTEWWQTHTKEQRDWLLTSQGKGIGALPADAQALLDNNKIKAKQLLNQYGVTNAEEVVNADGDTLVDFFATQLTTGAWTELNWINQAKGLGDPLAGIERDNQLVGWLENMDETMTIAETQAGYATAQALAQKWLGPNFANFEESNLAEYAGIIRNAESQEIGIAAVEEKLKNIRKALFSTDMYEENLTYEDIASPWRNYSFQFLGQRMDETSSEWIDVLKANDQEKINTILLEYGLNNDVQTMFDRVTDGIVKGITPQAVVRGLPT